MGGRGDPRGPGLTGSAVIAPEPGGAGQQAAGRCQRCGGPRPESSLRLCRPCGRDLVRRCQAYQVVSVAGLGAGRSAIAVRVGVN